MHYLLYAITTSSTIMFYTLSLHDALPIFRNLLVVDAGFYSEGVLSASLDLRRLESTKERLPDRKSTRLNSSHQIISYAVYCLKKKKYPHFAYLLLSLIPRYSYYHAYNITP